MKKDTPKQKNQISNFYNLKPNIKKIFLKNILSVFAPVLVVVIVLLVVNWDIGLDLFLIPFKNFGINIDVSRFVPIVASIIGVVMLFLFIGLYLVASDVKYEIYPDKLILYKNSFLFFSNSKEIPFENIDKVIYNDAGLFNSIFRSATIVLIVSGMKAEKIEMEFIDNVVQNVRYLQSLINRDKYIRQKKLEEQYKVGKIIDKY